MQQDDSTEGLVSRGQALEQNLDELLAEQKTEETIDDRIASGELKPIQPISKRIKKKIQSLIVAICFISNVYPFGRLRILLRNFDFFIFSLVALINLTIFFSMCDLSCLSNLKSVGKHTGTLVQWNFMLLFIPLPRKGLLRYLLHVSFENVIIFHRWLGRWIVSLTFVHGVLMFTYYYQRGAFEEVIHEFTKFKNLAGIISFIFLCIITLTSLPIIRRKLYDFFMKVHYISFVMVILFALLHKHGLQLAAMLAIPLLLYIADLALRFVLFLNSNHSVTSIKLVGEKYIRLDFKGFKRYNPGQYVFLYIPSIALFEVHPFSLITVPELTSTASLLIEVKGRWTNRLKNSLLDESRTIRSVWVEGAYGNLNIPFFMDLPLVVFVAGGIGIAPVMSLLSSLQCQRNKQHNEILLLWSCRTGELFKEFGEELGAFVGNPTNTSTRIQLYHTGEDELETSVEGEGSINSNAFYSCMMPGKPNFPDLFNEIADEAKQRNISRVGVFVCGSRRLRNIVLSSTCRTKTHCNFTIHAESFTL